MGVGVLINIIHIVIELCISKSAERYVGHINIAHSYTHTSKHTTGDWYDVGFRCVSVCAVSMCINEPQLFD